MAWFLLDSGQRLNGTSRLAHELALSFSTPRNDLLSNINGTVAQHQTTLRAIRKNLVAGFRDSSEESLEAGLDLGRRESLHTGRLTKLAKGLL